MAWAIEGCYVENCSCDVICPCTWSNLARPATQDDCRAARLPDRAGHGRRCRRDRPHGGLLARDTELMVEGNWRAGLIFDGDTTDEQMEGLTKVFTGAARRADGRTRPADRRVPRRRAGRHPLESGDDGWTLRVGDDTSLAGDVVRAPETDAAGDPDRDLRPPGRPTLTVTPSPDDALVAVRHRLRRASHGAASPPRSPGPPEP